MWQVAQCQCVLHGCSDGTAGSTAAAGAFFRCPRCCCMVGAHDGIGLVGWQQQAELRWPASPLTLPVPCLRRAAAVEEYGDAAEMEVEAGEGGEGE